MSYIQQSGTIFRRCRDYHLYDLKGKRFLDMYLAGGNCLFGHKPRGLGKYLKAALDQGLTGAYSSVCEKRLLSWLEKHYEDYWPRLFNSCLSMEKALSSLDIAFSQFQDPALCNNCDNPYQIQRYFLKLPGNLSIIKLIPALPGLEQCQLLLFRKADFPDLPASDWISPFVLAGLFYMLDHAAFFLDKYQATLRQLPPNPLFQQKGPYLRPLFSREKLAFYQQKFLHAGLLITEDYSTPSILPLEMSDGEFQKIIKCCGEADGT